MQYSADASLAKFPIAEMRPGDVIVLNDPFQGGTHINDITFTMPIFLDDTLLGFAVSRGHWMDLGGGAAGGQSFGTHVAGEGLRLPPTKLYENYNIREEILDIIVSNTPRRTSCAATFRAISARSRRPRRNFSAGRCATVSARWKRECAR